MESRQASRRLLRLLQWISVPLAVVIVVIIIWQQQRQQRELAAEVRDHNHLKMEAVKEHVEEYLDLIQMELRFISLDDEVVAMTRESRDYIQAIFEANYERLRLSEIYVIQREFDGTARPFMTFEHGDEHHHVDELHSLESEEEEYQTQVEHIRRFAEDPSLKTLISRPVQLCVDKMGVVVSVPIRSHGELVGIVAGMVPSENIAAALGRGNYSNMVALVNQRGDFFSCEDLPSETEHWFKRQFAAQGVSEFFQNQEDTFLRAEYTALWTPAEIPGDQKWFLVFMYDEAVYMGADGFARAFTVWGICGTVLLLGIAVALLWADVAKRQVLEFALRQAEQAAREQAVALEEFNIKLEQANWEAEKANRAKSDFLANMSHEIRTPMTAVLGFTELLAEGCLGACDFGKHQMSGFLDTIKCNGEYLLELINDILDLSKIEAGKLEVQRTACSPANIVADVASLMRVRAEAKNLALEIEYEGPIPETIRCDSVRLRQILINLTGNAIKFTETGSVRLTTRLVGGAGKPPCLQFDVIDTGIGMTPGQVSRLFRPFTQVDPSTTREYQGTGLGLAISKRLAEMLDGDVSVSSSPGKGSTFSVTIETGPLDGVPMLDNPQEAIANTPKKTSSSPKRTVQLDCRILLAEDGPDNQRLISFLLEKAGADVTVAENGKVALQCVQTAHDQGNPFDLILMDMQMPVMDGYSATRKLRETSYQGPILALTANAMVGDDEKCRLAGCDDYLTKPVDRSTFLPLIAKYAQTATAIPAS